MINSILTNAYKDVLEDTKLVRLATITTIFHSLIMVLYVIYQTHFVITNLSDGAVKIDFEYYWNYLFGHSSVLLGFVIVAIVLIVGYYLLPPIAQGSLIHYIDSKNKSGTLSLSKGFMKFFPLFEFNGIISFFQYVVFFVAVSRFYVMGVLENGFVISILIIWFILIIFVDLLLPYVIFLIVLENRGVYESIRESIVLTTENMKITFKFFLISYSLYIKFLFNIILVLGVPFVLTYFIIKLGWEDNGIFLIYFVLLLMVILASYLNGIIQAFFISYWYRVYSTIRKTDNLTSSE